MIRRQGMPENLVLGTNAYTSALQETVEGWPELWMTVPLYVSEFGAAGLGPGERSAVLRRMWGVIRAWPQWTFGGAVYVWTTDGPEEVDRVFGLVDGRGIPVDDALATIADLYRAEAER